MQDCKQDISLLGLLATEKLLTAAKDTRQKTLAVAYEAGLVTVQWML